MNLKTLSASSVKNWEACPAMCGASSFNRIPQGPAMAADLGSACHQALETFVEAVHMKHEIPDDLNTLLSMFDIAHRFYFPGSSFRKKEGIEMMKKWHERTDFTDRKVLSVEIKKNFLLPTSIGNIPFNYIFDRCDHLHGTDSIEVVDYKSWIMPRTTEDMVEDPQMRAYGLAGAIEYKDLNPKYVWVTLDQLRFEQASTRFTRDQNKETFIFLQEVAEKMIAGIEGKLPEKLNPLCRFCIRRHDCGELQKHLSVQGPFALNDPVAATKKLADITNAMAGLKSMEEDIQRFLIDYAHENNDLDKWGDDEIVAEIKYSRRRDVDPQRVADIVGAEIFSRMGNITMGSIDVLLKGNEITPDQKRAINASIGMKYGEPKVKAKYKGGLSV